MAILSAEDRFRDMIVPFENGNEATVVKGLNVYGASHLLDIVHYFRGEGELNKFDRKDDPTGHYGGHGGLNFSDIKGQALRAGTVRSRP